MHKPLKRAKTPIDKQKRANIGNNRSLQGCAGHINNCTFVTVQGGADYDIPLGGSIIPKKGSPDLGNGTFTNADATNRNYFHPDTGYLTAAAANTARFQLAGDGKPALFVEPGGTNSCLQSRTFDTTWSGTIETSGATGIDGTAAAWTLEDDNAGGVEYLSQAITVPDDSNTHCFSLYIAKDSTTSRFPELAIVLSGGSTINHYVMWNSSTGALNDRLNSASDSYGIIDMDDYGLSGWWRIWVNITNDSSGSTTLTAYLTPARGKSLGASDNDAVGTIIVDQAQCELNQSFPSNPIITTTTAVSRTTEAGFPNWDLPFEYGDEKIVNGTMEADSDWDDRGTPTTNERSSTRAHSGTYSRKIVADGATEGIQSAATFNVIAGCTYKASGWIYIETATATVQVTNFTGALPAFGANALVTAVGAWTYFETYVVAVSSGAERVRTDGNKAMTYYVDDLSVKRADTVFAESLGAEEITDGDMSSDSFSVQAPWVHDAGNEEYDIDGSQTGEKNLYQNPVMTIGKTYKCTYTVQNYVAGGVNVGFGVSNYIGWNTDGDGTYTVYGICAGNGALYFKANATLNASIDDVSLKEVLNPSSEGGPPRGTVVAWYRPSHGYADAEANNALISLKGSSGATLLYSKNDGNITTYDSASGSSVDINYAINTWYKLAVQFGYLTSNVAQLRVGADTGSGIAWDATPAGYDGAFDVTGSLITLAETAGPFHIRDIEIYPDEIRTDGQIDAGGSP